MADRPLIFSAPMVRALLDGRKTMTRRVFKWQGPKSKGGAPYPHSWEHAFIDNPAGVQRLLVPYKHPEELHLEWGDHGYIRHYGPADPGDRLWVREGWCPNVLVSGGSERSPAGVHYRADGMHVVLDDGDGFAAYRKDGSERSPWRSPIHMPRWASRLTLTVTEVRVERLHDISEEDAVAEGCPAQTYDELAGMDARGWFRDLWESIHGAGSWAANPWACVVRFKVTKENSDDRTD